MVSVVVVGNCQARPVADMLKRAMPDIDIAGIGIVHLLKNDEAETYERLFTAADLIFAQRVTDNYPVTFVRTGELKARYSEKVVSWPNLFFEGCNPELFYLRDAKKTMLGGPLRDYHNKTFFDAWRKGLGVEEAIRLNHDADYNQSQYAGVVEKSLNELRNRESDCDVKMADWVADNFVGRRLFFTFNHPTAVALQELGNRLLKARGVLAGEPIAAVSPAGEPLGQMQSPVNEWIRKTYGLRFDCDAAYHGYDFSLEAGKVVYKTRKTFSEDEVVHQYYTIYDTLLTTNA